MPAVLVKEICIYAWTPAQLCSFQQTILRQLPVDLPCEHMEGWNIKQYMQPVSVLWALLNTCDSCVRVMQDGSGVKDVCVLFSKLTAAQEGSTIVLADQQHLLLPARSPNSATAVSSSSWAFAAIWPQQGIISNSSVNSGLFSLCQSHTSGPKTPVFCTVSGGGKTLASGTLELAEHACIVFDASCADTLIDGTVFKGTAAPFTYQCLATDLRQFM